MSGGVKVENRYKGYLQELLNFTDNKKLNLTARREGLQSKKKGERNWRYQRGGNIKNEK